MNEAPAATFSPGFVASNSYTAAHESISLDPNLSGTTEGCLPGAMSLAERPNLLFLRLSRTRHKT